MSRQEEPQLQCRAIIIPAGVRQMFKEGVISLKEGYLASVIDALVHCGGEGCWASNQYLADELQVEKRQLIYLLAHLKSLGVVLEKVVKGKRFLEASWSRASEHGGHKDRMGAVNCTKGCSKLHSPPMQKTAPIDKRECIENKKEKNPAPQSRGRGASFGVPSSNGHESNGHSTQPTTTATQPLSIQIATRLRAIVVEVFHIPNPWSKIKWAEQISILERRYGAERLESVFNWYEQNASRQEELRLPRVKSATHFKNTFDWIEQVMKKTDWDEGVIGI